MRAGQQCITRPHPARDHTGVIRGIRTAIRRAIRVFIDSGPPSAYAVNSGEHVVD